MRPLFYYSEENFVEPLTPSHLLHGHQITSLPDIECSKVSDLSDWNTSTKRMCHLSKLLSHFWTRWIKMYLIGLLERHNLDLMKKGGTLEPPVRDIVVILDDNLPRSRLRMGKDERLIRGKDNFICGAAVKTTTKTGQSSMLDRP